MTQSEYLSALTRLGLTRTQAAKVCGQDDRTHRRYADGTREIPEPVARLLRACERWPGLLDELAGRALATPDADLTDHMERAMKKGDEAVAQAQREMKPIPIRAARRIAEDYGYDQVIIIARKTGGPTDDCGEHCTTYGVTPIHCATAANIGDFLKFKVMGWVQELRP